MFCVHKDLMVTIQMKLEFKQKTKMIFQLLLELFQA
jgi:hypothetical protein